MPYTNHIGVSQRIEMEEERERLRSMMEHVLEGIDDVDKKGFILRTAADGVDEDSLRRDVEFCAVVAFHSIAHANGHDGQSGAATYPCRYGCCEMKFPPWTKFVDSVGKPMPRRLNLRRTSCRMSKR